MLSALLAALFAMFLAAEVLAPHSGPPTTLREWLGIGLICAGFLSAPLGWRWELPAALISLGCFAAFSIVIEPLPPVLVAAIPGILFLADWYLRRRIRRTALT
jgi:hypothetical protein